MLTSQRSTDSIEKMRVCHLFQVLVLQEYFDGTAFMTEKQSIYDMEISCYLNHQLRQILSTSCKQFNQLILLWNINCTGTKIDRCRFSSMNMVATFCPDGPANHHMKSSSCNTDLLNISLFELKKRSVWLDSNRYQRNIRQSDNIVLVAQHIAL